MGSGTSSNPCSQCSRPCWGLRWELASRAGQGRCLWLRGQAWPWLSQAGPAMPLLLHVSLVAVSLCKGATLLGCSACRALTKMLFRAGHNQATSKTLRASGQGKGPAAGPQGMPPGYGMPYWGMHMQPMQPMQGQMMPGQMPPTYSMPQQFGMLQQQLPGIKGGPGHVPVHRQAGVQVVALPTKGP